MFKHALKASFGAAFVAAGLMTAPALAQSQTQAKFAKPVALKSGAEVIRVEAPGYAAPSWADMNGDGKKDLLVGQFNDGKIQIFPNLGEGKFGAGEWLMADEKVGKVSGVW